MHGQTHSFENAYFSQVGSKLFSWSRCNFHPPIPPPCNHTGYSSFQGWVAPGVSRRMVCIPDLKQPYFYRHLRLSPPVFVIAIRVRREAIRKKTQINLSLEDCQQLGKMCLVVGPTIDNRLLLMGHTKSNVYLIGFLVFVSGGAADSKLMPLW